MASDGLTGLVSLKRLRGGEICSTGPGKKGGGRKGPVPVQRNILYLEDYEPRHLKSQDEAPISVKTQGSFTPSGSRSLNSARIGIRATEVWSG
jgi:hypothetical protein